MAEDSRVAVVCASAALTEGGPGVRFTVHRSGKLQQAFAIRFHGQVRAFVNECRHERSELDWHPGQFFDDAKLYLVCATHGALYAPDSGLCVAGPCRGARLLPLSVRERDGNVFCDEASGTSRSGSTAGDSSTN
jgi:nitrite reductase/ring-hydroxylating ferredoxin subunit